MARRDRVVPGATAAAARRRRLRCRDRRRRLHRPVGGVPPGPGAAGHAHRRLRARDRRVRAVGPQRRLGVGRADRERGHLRARGRPGCRPAGLPRDVRRGRPRRRGRRARGHRLRLPQGRVAVRRDDAAPAGPAAGAAARARRGRAGRGGLAVARGCGIECRRRGRGLPRGVVFAPLRARRPGPARPRPGRGLRAARRRDLRAHARHRGRAAPAGDGARQRLRRCRPPGDGVLLGAAARPAPALPAALLADDRHRAAAPARLGRDRLDGRRPRQRHAPPLLLRAAHRATAGSRSAAVARRTG